MTNETTENFLKVMAEFQWPDPQPVEYRLYYNDDATPKCYSMEDLPGKYIKVDCETFALKPWNVRVVNDRLIFIQPPITVNKLQPNQKSGTFCHVSDVCVVVSKLDTHTVWNKVTHETN
jgi:hypothetical protein